MKIEPGEMMRRLAHRGAAPWLTLAIALLMTFVVTWLVAVSERAYARARFENAVASARDRIASRLDLYEAALRGLAALYAASRSVTPEEFRAYAERLDLRRTYPGIQGVGWAERVRTDPTGARDITSIRYLEPQDARNQAAIGYDMYSEPVRRTAMGHARDYGAATLSGRVRLVQEIYGRTQAGFLLYVPVYVGSTTPGTVLERRRTLLGWVYAPFRADDLFAGIFGSEREPRVSFKVYDGDSARAEALLHASHRLAQGIPRYMATRRLQIAGRPWTVVVASEPALEAPWRFQYATLTAAIGLLISLVLFVLVLRLEGARREAEQANVIKARFLANMSHELRTPLNAICGYIDLLQAGVYGPIREDQERAHERIKVASAHLLRLIEDVLTFARLEAGRTSYSLMPVHLRYVLEQAEALILPQAETAGLRYQRLDAHPGDGSTVVLADPDKLQQVLLNLLSNAIKFTPAGGTVRVRTTEHAHQVEIAIEDTGVGIAAEEMATLFAPFVQIDTALTRKHQGAGLGLAISRELARGMGGDITASSTPGAGSVFRVLVPRAPVPRTHAHGHASAAAGERAGGAPA